MGFEHGTIAGKVVHPLGLAGNFGIDPAGVRAAADRGITYFYVPAGSKKRYVAAVADVIKGDRERFVLASGPTLAFAGGSVRKACEKMLGRLGVDYLDVFQLHWLSKMSAWTDGTVEALVKLKEEGKVRFLGTSIHDRVRAGRLAADSPLDLLMIRYNAAHPGAETDIFPHLPPEKRIVAYTATSWRKLLKAPSGWTGKVASAGDCYRFCLTDPHVTVVLNGPKDREQLNENLDAVERGPLDADELAWIREFGRVVHG